MRDNRAALGLTAADVDALTLADRTLTPGTGITHLRYRQAYGGIPAFDNGLRVNLDRGGRILNVTGSPLSGLAQSTRSMPTLDAVAAMRALQRDVGRGAGDRRHVRAGRRPPRDAASPAATSRASSCSAPRAAPGSRGT